MSAGTGKISEDELNKQYSLFLKALIEAIQSESNFQSQLLQEIALLKKIKKEKIKHKDSYLTDIMLSALQEAFEHSQKTFNTYKEIQTMIPKDLFEGISTASHKDIRRFIDTKLFSKNNLEGFLSKFNRLLSENDTYYKGLSESVRIFGLIADNKTLTEQWNKIDNSAYGLAALTFQRLTRKFTPVEEMNKALEKIQTQSAAPAVNELTQTLQNIVTNSKANVKFQNEVVNKLDDYSLQNKNPLKIQLLQAITTYQTQTGQPKPKSISIRQMEQKLQKLLNTASELTKINLRMRNEKPRTQKLVEAFYRKLDTFIKRLNQLTPQEKAMLQTLSEGRLGNLDVVLKIVNRAGAEAKKYQELQTLPEFTVTAKNATFAKDLKEQLRSALSKAILKSKLSKKYKIIQPPGTSNFISITDENNQDLITLKKEGSTVMIRVSEKGQNALGYLTPEEQKEVYKLLRLVTATFHRSLKKEGNKNVSYGIKTTPLVFKSAIPIGKIWPLDKNTQNKFKASIQAMENNKISKLENKVNLLLNKILSSNHKLEQHSDSFENDVSQAMKSDTPYKISVGMHKTRFTEAQNEYNELQKELAALLSIDNKRIKDQLQIISNRRGLEFANKDLFRNLTKMKQQIESIPKLQRNADVFRIFRHNLKETSDSIQTVTNDFSKNDLFRTLEKQKDISATVKKYEQYFETMRQYLPALKKEAVELQVAGIVSQNFSKQALDALSKFVLALATLESQFSHVKQRLERAGHKMNVDFGATPEPKNLLLHNKLTQEAVDQHIEHVLGGQLAWFYKKHSNILDPKKAFNVETMIKNIKNMNEKQLIETISKWETQIKKQQSEHRNEPAFKKQMETAQKDLEALSSAVKTAKSIRRPSP